MLSDLFGAHVERSAGRLRLNAPFGARCFLTKACIVTYVIISVGLNAPFGARCFLTTVPLLDRSDRIES